MANPLFVLVKPPAAMTWALVAGPVDAVEAAPIVSSTIREQPRARVIVVSLLRSYVGVVLVNEDAVAAIE